MFQAITTGLRVGRLTTLLSLCRTKCTNYELSFTNKNAKLNIISTWCICVDDNQHGIKINKDGWIRNRYKPMKNGKRAGIDTVYAIKYCQTTVESGENQGRQPPRGVTRRRRLALLQQVSCCHILVATWHLALQVWHNWCDGFALLFEPNIQNGNWNLTRTNLISQCIQTSQKQPTILWDPYVMLQNEFEYNVQSNVRYNVQSCSMPFLYQSSF